MTQDEKGPSRRAGRRARKGEPGGTGRRRGGYTIATPEGAIIAEVRRIWPDDPDGYYEYNEDAETSDGFGNVSGRYDKGEIQA